MFPGFSLYNNKENSSNHDQTIMRIFGVSNVRDATFPLSPIGADESERKENSGTGLIVPKL